MIVYFDIDGVLNDTPQLGGRAPWIRPDAWAFLVSLGVPLVCISTHRGRPDVLRGLFGVDVPCARADCYKRYAVPSDPAILVIDDQPGEYALTTRMYMPDGRVGLTQRDMVAIRAIVNSMRSGDGIERRTGAGTRAGA